MIREGRLGLWAGDKCQKRSVAVHASLPRCTSEGLKAVHSPR